MSRKSKKGRYDYSLLTAVFLLVGIGLVILYSTSAYNGEVKFHDSFYYLKKQAFATILGIILMFAMANIDYHIWQHFAVFAYIVALILSTAVLFIGDEYNGSKRWLSLGPFSFQPSEYAKVALILFLSYIVMKNVKKIDKVRTLIKIIGSILPIVALVGSNNLSTAVIILGIAIILIFVSSPKYTQFITMGILAVGFLGIFLALESYRLERLAIWRNPEKYEKGYQTLQGLYAIGSGGLFGRGLGSSIQKLGFVPEAQNDMIFSIICEELGLFGAIFIIVLFMILIWRFFVIATHAKDLFGALIATGAMGHIMIQVILNIAVVTNSIPNTGITLPFISYGGTSVMFLLLEMGLVLSVSNLIE
ncbi:stage V sporulation protein E [Faecalimonas hominis]